MMINYSTNVKTGTTQDHWTHKKVWAYGFGYPGPCLGYISYANVAGNKITQDHNPLTPLIGSQTAIQIKTNNKKSSTDSLPL